MAMQLEKFTVKNEKRGAATVLATFNVNLGPISLNGFELVKAGKGVFVSEPCRLYEKAGERKKFNYVWFNKGKGEELKQELFGLAKKEYERRSGSENSGNGSFDNSDEDLPF